MTKELIIKELVIEQDEGYISGGEDYIGGGSSNLRRIQPSL